MKGYPGQVPAGGKMYHVLELPVPGPGPFTSSLPLSAEFLGMGHKANGQPIILYKALARDSLVREESFIAVPTLIPFSERGNYLGSCTLFVVRGEEKVETMIHVFSGVDKQVIT